MPEKFLGVDNQKFPVLDNLVDIQENSDQIIEMAAEQFAYLLWEYLTTREALEAKSPQSQHFYN